MTESPRAAGDSDLELALEETATQDPAFASLLRNVAGAPAGSVVVTTTPAAVLAPGTVLDDKLRIERELGRGGMGVVYLSQHLQLSRRVALKLTTGAATSVARERLLREARAMASITHENVVTVYDVGTIDDQVFIAMEYLDGGTARSWLADATRSWRDVVALYVAAGRGLAAAHARGVIHRDFKPDNVLVGGDGAVRVADFGLARAAHSPDGAEESLQATIDEQPSAEGLEHSAPPSRGTQPNSRLTVTGAAVGTPAYMAPEQFQAQPADAASDQFAFCVSLFEALFGQRPFRGRTISELLEAIGEQQIFEPTENSAVPGHVRRALHRGLSANAADRFPNMDALVRELRRDPAASLRRGAATVAVISATALGTWLFVRGETDPCNGSDALLTPVWSAEVAQTVEAGFLATELAYAGDTWSRASTQLDAYADAWTAAHREACEASRLHNTQSAELMDLRMACLERRRLALAATVEILANPDATTVREAPAAVSELPRIAPCANLEALREVGAIPEEKRAAVAEVRTTLALAKANLDTGHLKEGRALADEAAARAAEVSLPIVAAESALVMMAAYRLGTDWEAARAEARAGIAIAILARDDEIAAKLATALVYIEGYQLQMVGSEVWAELADSWIARIGSPPEYRAGLLENRALVAREHAHYEEALRYLEEALPLQPEGAGRATIGTRGMLAETYRRRGDLEAAAGLYEENLREAELLLGPSHPMLAQELNNAAAVLMRLSRNSEARAHFQRALEIRLAAFGEQHELVAQTLGNLGMLALSENDLDDAIELLERARRAGGDKQAPVTKLSILGALGGAYLQRGDVEHAGRLMREALEIGDASLGPTNPRNVDARYNLALLEHRRGDAEAAMRLLARALDDLRASDQERPFAEALLLALRGRLKQEAGDHEAALVDLEAAIDGMRDEQRPFPYRFEPLALAGRSALALGQNARALSLYEQAFAEDIEVLGPEDLRAAYEGLARARLATGDRSGAHEAALEARRQTNDGDADAIETADALVRSTR